MAGTVEVHSWCYRVVTLVLPCCYSGVTFVLYSGSTVMLLWCNNVCVCGTIKEVPAACHVCKATHPDVSNTYYGMHKKTKT
jgi:hypothetical protein